MGKPSGAGGGTTKSVTEPWRASQPFLEQLLGGTANQYDAGGFDIQPWPGIRVAPQSGMTQGGLQGISDMATAGNPVTGPAQDAFAGFMNQDPYRDLDTLRENALGNIMPAAMSRFSGDGMLDSTLAADAAGRAATQALAPFEYGEYNNMQNRQLSAMGMAPQMAGLSYLDSNMLLGAGAQQDAFSQNVLNAAIGQFGEEQNRPYNELQRAASLGLGFGGMGGTQSQSGGGGGGGGTMGTVGDIMQTVGPLIAMAAFMSDRRLKRDIRRVGTTLEGYPQYEFRYLWDDEVHIGVMADEVPEDITIGVGGFMAVDYSRVTLERIA